MILFKNTFRRSLIIQYSYFVLYCRQLLILSRIHDGCKRSRNKSPFTSTYIDNFLLFSNSAIFTGFILKTFGEPLFYCIVLKVPFFSWLSRCIPFIFPCLTYVLIMVLTILSITLF